MFCAPIQLFRGFGLFLVLLVLCSSLVGAGDLEEMTLGELLKQHPELYRDSDTASGVSEALRDAPASMVVLRQKDFRRRGYDSLDDLLFGLPGFDVIRTGGTMETVAYQRGYRTPWTQRTLLLVNGKPDNNLWNHGAQISRQYPIGAIDRVETLYGPAGAVYGPNAFLGVINIITRDASELEDGETYFEISGALGSYDTQNLDTAFGGRWGEVSFDIGFNYFNSDEAGIEDYSDWGYTDPSLLSNPAAWGAGIGAGADPATGRFSPAGDLDVDGFVEEDELVRGSPIGEYADPTEDYGFIGELRFSGTTFGAIVWETNEGYGPYYSFLDGQPNSLWTHSSRQYYIEREDWLIDEAVRVESELVYRESRVGGEEWAESFGGFVSLSDWNSFNKAWRLEQRFTFSKTDDLQFNGGWKYEFKRLNRAYILSNYWDGLGVAVGESSVQAAADVSSESPMRLSEDIDDRYAPDFNASDTDDIGIYAQMIYDRGDLRFNGSLRWDENSAYGSDYSPRGALIYHKDAETTFKLVYGEAFQEPSPKDLYGAYAGRTSNSALRPEKVYTTEFVAILQHERFQHDFSVYHSEFQNAIATGQNVGGRDVVGFEYKNSFRVENPISGSAAISGNLFYTYTRSVSDQQYENATGTWVDQRAAQGDVAPHKVNLNLNIPIGKKLNANFSGLWVGERKLFSENPLRADSNSERSLDRKAEAYSLVDLNLLYSFGDYSVSFKVENLFEEDYLVPGVESAASGDDFTVDRDGFQNSLIPQVKERKYTLRVSFDL
ncbi:TonB-dependent receptor domain protein [Verrucomicrobiia bacterium DG1235]|nr:TonB-dependent receptor domain protein [Verrucomicrobiae bacterium DG1235]